MVQIEERRNAYSLWEGGFSMQKTYTYETEYCMEYDRDTVIEVRFLYQPLFPR